MNLTRLPLAAGGGAPGGAEEELHPGDVRDRYPSFSPDGKHVAFVDTQIGEGAALLDFRILVKNDGSVWYERP